MTDQRWTIKPGRVPALLWPDDENPDMPFSFTEADLAEMLPDALDRQVASAFAALRDALARDAQVREIVQSMRTATVQGDVWAVVGRLAALYPEVASMLRDGEG